MSSNVKQADRFRIITGIGDARENWLQEKFNVYTFRALASLTVVEIERELVEAPSAISRGVERNDIATWLYEAGKLANQTSDKKSETGWHGDAFIIVEFQTRADADGILEKQTTAFDMVSDQGDKWTGHNMNDLSKWISGLVTQLATPQNQKITRANTQKKVAPKKISPISSLVFKMIKIVIYQPQNRVGEVGVCLPDTIFSGNLLGDMPFNMICQFALGKENNETSFAEAVPYRLELFATNRETGKVVLLGQIDEVVDEAGLLIVEINEVCLMSGVYRVEAIVTSPGYPCKPGFMEIPLLRTI